MRRSVPFLALAALFLFPTAARADTSFTIEPIVSISKKRSEPSLGGTFTRTFEKSKFGVSGFWWVTGSWAEGYAGPTYAATPWLTLGVGAGAEQNTGFTNLQDRYNVNFTIATETFKSTPFFLSGSFEVNRATFHGDASGIWYDGLMTVTPREWLTAGARGRRYIGVGPFVQMNVTEMHTKIWVLWALADPDQKATPFSSALLGTTLEL